MFSKNFVVFLSAGTFCSEQTKKEIFSWNVDEAVEMSYDIVERYGAIPYGFYFTAKERGDYELDSHEIRRSGVYYLGGIVETLEDVEKRANSEDDTLLWNMRTNGWDRIITNTNSWKVTHPLKDNDVILPYVKKD
jgi:hypothetical protein